MIKKMYVAELSDKVSVQLIFVRSGTFGGSQGLFTVTFVNVEQDRVVNQSKSASFVSARNPLWKLKMLNSPS